MMKTLGKNKKKIGQTLLKNRKIKIGSMQHQLLNGTQSRDAPFRQEK